MMWMDVSPAIVERAITTRRAARGSDEAWESFVASLLPGREMDAVVVLSVIGDSSIRMGAPRASTDFDQAMELVRMSEAAVTITYHPQVRPDDPEEGVHAEVFTLRSHGDRVYSGEWTHRPLDDFRDPDDLARMEADRADDPEDVSDWHECGKARCMADAVVRALLVMYSPTPEELAGATE